MKFEEELEEILVSKALIPVADKFLKGQATLLELSEAVEKHTRIMMVIRDKTT